MNNDSVETKKPSPKEARAMLWNQGELRWKLHSAQLSIHQTIHDSKDNIIVIACSRRLGKTFLMCLLALETCLKKPLAIVKFISPKQKQVKTNIRPIINQILKDCPIELRPEFKTADGLYIFPNGSEIQLAGTDNQNHENLRGGSADLCIVDEAGFCDELGYVIDSILSPTTDTTGGKVIVVSTPSKSPDHEFITKYVFPAEERGTLIRRTIYDNPLLKPEDIEKIIKRYEAKGGKNSTDFRREYLVEIIVDADMAVVPEFTAELQEKIVKEVQRPSHYDSYVSMDVGFKDLTVVLFAYYDFKNSQVVIEDEFVVNGAKMTTDYLASQIIEKENSLWRDPISRLPKPPYMRVSDTDLILLNNLYTMHRLIFFPTKKDNKEAALNDMRMKLQDEKIIINPKCKTLIAHLKNAIWNKNRTSFQRSSDMGHFDACFVPNSKVFTSKGLKNIQDIEKGDLVLTHLGNFKPVKQLLCREYNDKILEIDVAGRENILCTPDHKFWTSELKRTTNEFLTGQLTAKDPKWIEAQKLVTSKPNAQVRHGVYATYPNNKTKYSISNEMSFLYGYYVAEGSLGGNGCQIQFAGHSKEKKVLQILQEAITKEYGWGKEGISRKSKYRHKKGICLPQLKKARFIQRSKNSRTIYISEKELWQKLKLLGKSTHKKFPDFIYLLNEEQAFYMLCGYLFGDGHFSNKGIMANSISQNIIYQLEFLALKCGVSGSIGFAKRKDRWKGLSKTGLTSNDQWTIRFDKLTSIAITHKINSLPDLCYTFQDKLIHNIDIKLFSQLETNIKTINSLNIHDYKGLVYSLEVEDDHSYTINGIAVKNCDALAYLIRNIQYHKNPYPKGLGYEKGDWFFPKSMETLDKTASEVVKWLNIKVNK